jgi:hypothetical protein
MTRMLKECFCSGAIGMRPKRLVFGQETGDPNVDAAREQKKATEKREGLDPQATEKAKTELSSRIAELDKEVDKNLKSPNANIKAAAERARAALDKIKTPGQSLDYPQIQENLRKIRLIPGYMKESTDYEKPLAENRKLKEKSLKPLMDRIDQHFTQYVNIPAYSKLSAEGKAEIAKMKETALASINKVVEGLLPMTVKGQFTFDEYLADQDAFKKGQDQLKVEKALLNNPEGDLFKKVSAEVENTEKKDADQLAVCYTDISKNEKNGVENEVELVDGVFKSQMESLADYTKQAQLKNPEGFKAEIFQICDKATKQLQTLPGEQNAPKRALVLAQMRDSLVDMWAKITEKPLVDWEKNAAVRGVVKRTAGLPAGSDVAALAKELGIDQTVLENAAKEATPNAPPPVKEATAVQPPKPETTQAQPAMNVNPDIAARAQRLNNPELAQMVTGAPSEYHDAMIKIAEGGEKIGEIINFKLLFNKTYLDCSYVKVGPDNYKIRMPDPATGAITDLYTYKNRETAMKELQNGVFLQRMTITALLNPLYYKNYEKKVDPAQNRPMIDMKGKPQRTTELVKNADPWSVTFQLDWAGVSDISGNPYVTVKAMPYGGISYIVKRDGVGIHGEQTRTGFASSMDDLFRQLSHLQSWAEQNDKRTPEQRTAAEAQELKYSQLNNPSVFFAHQTRIGRPIYFGVNSRTGNTDISLDWGGGADTNPKVNPYIRMRLNPDGTYTYSVNYQGTKTPEATVAKTSDIVERLALMRATMRGETYSTATLTPEQRTALRANPMAGITENIARPAVAPAQTAAAAPAAAPSQPAVAPAQPATAPQPTAAPGAVPAVATDKGPVKTAESASEQTESANKPIEKAEAERVMSAKIREVMSKYTTMDPVEFMKNVAGSRDLHNKIMEELHTYVSTIQVNGNERAHVEVNGLELYTPAGTDWSNDTWSQRVFLEKSQEARDQNYKKYKEAVRSISDYMNGAGTAYLKENIGNGTINTAEQLGAALVNLFGVAANQARYEKPAAGTTAQFEISINNIRSYVAFSADKPPLWKSADLGQEIARTIISQDPKLTESPLAKVLSIRPRPTAVPTQTAAAPAQPAAAPAQPEAAPPTKTG